LFTTLGFFGVVGAGDEGEVEEEDAAVAEVVRPTVAAKEAVPV